MSANQNNPTENNADREIVISRIFDAPRELVWEAWTNPQHVAQWWGPNGFSTTIEKMDVRAGGVWKQTMRGPDGMEYPNESVFQEVVKPERIVFSHGGGKKGGPSVHKVMTWTFEAIGEKTKLTIHQLYSSAADCERVVKEFGAIEGGKQTLARLAEYLPKMAGATPEFVITRLFDAPRELVWKTFTDPEHMQHWWGPKGFKARVVKMDFWPGGVYLYSLKSPDGHEMWGKFVYREIVAPERVVLINSFSDENGGLTRHPLSPTWPLEMLSVFTFAEQDGKTLFTLKWSPYNATDTERQTFEAGRKSMQGGWTGTLDQLTEYLSKIQK